MKAIILAAGRGSRMGKLTDQQPKCLVTVGGTTLLERQLSALREAGIHEIAIVTGYRHELLANQVAKTFHNAHWQTTNMVASLACATDWLDTSPCIISYSDIFYSAESVLKLVNCMSSIAVAFDSNWKALWQARFTDPLSDAETFSYDDAGDLTDIGGRAEHIDEIHGQYMGLLRLNPAGWGAVKQVRQTLSQEEWSRMDMTSLLRKLLNGPNLRISVCACSGIWGEVDSATDRDLYERLYFSKSNPYK